MKDNLILTIIEMTISLIIEGIILAMVFNWIANKSTEKQQQNLQTEMQNLEKQNRLDFENIMQGIQQSKTELISQIKESEQKGGH